VCIKLRFSGKRNQLVLSCDEEILLEEGPRSRAEFYIPAGGRNATTILWVIGRHRRNGLGRSKKEEERVELPEAVDPNLSRAGGEVKYTYEEKKKRLPHRFAITDTSTGSSLDFANRGKKGLLGCAASCQTPET